MRNKHHVQQTLSQIETIQQSFIQFIKNSRISEQERQFLEKQIEASKQSFEQMKTYLNQEEEVWNNR